jgi:hypothetical protein
MAARQPDALHRSVINLAMKGFWNGEALNEATDNFGGESGLREALAYELYQISPSQFSIRVDAGHGRSSRYFVLSVREQQS